MKTHDLFPGLKGKAPTAEAKSKKVQEIIDDLRFQELIMKAVTSGKFKKWTPEQAARKHIAAKSKPPADERHYSPNELAAAWGLSGDTIRALFENEPGVLVMGDAKGTKQKRRYRTIKIPQSVAVRVKNRLSARPAPLRGKP